MLVCVCLVNQCAVLLRRRRRRRRCSRSGARPGADQLIEFIGRLLRFDVVFERFARHPREIVVPTEQKLTGGNKRKESTGTRSSKQKQTQNEHVEVGAGGSPR